MSMHPIISINWFTWRVSIFTHTKTLLLGKENVGVRRIFGANPFTGITFLLLLGLNRLAKHVLRVSGQAIDDLCLRGVSIQLTSQASRGH